MALSYLTKNQTASFCLPISMIQNMLIDAVFLFKLS